MRKKALFVIGLINSCLTVSVGIAVGILLIKDFESRVAGFVFICMCVSVAGTFVIWREYAKERKIGQGGGCFYEQQDIYHK